MNNMGIMLVVWFSASTCSMLINTTKNFKRLKKVEENQSKIVFFASQPCLPCLLLLSILGSQT
jgi:hypothetical protein